VDRHPSIPEEIDTQESRRATQEVEQASVWTEDLLSGECLQGQSTQAPNDGAEKGEKHLPQSVWERPHPSSLDLPNTENSLPGRLDCR
jgi:hypothetical protein